MKIILLFFLVLLYPSLLAQNFNTLLEKLEKAGVQVTDYVEKDKSGAQQSFSGSVNWTKGYVEAHGICFLNPSDVERVGRDYAIEIAKEGAEADGRANLLKMFMAVKIYDSVRVVDLMHQKHITVQTFKGYIRARMAGEPVVSEKHVKVTMRADLDGNPGPIMNLMENDGITDTKTEIERIEKLINAFKKEGIISNDETTVPPIMIQLPKEQAELLNPEFIPNISIIDTNGKKHDLRLTTNGNKRMGNVFKIINAAKPLISDIGLNNVPVLNGYIKDGNIVIDLNEVAKKPTGKKILKIMKSVGGFLIDALPVIAAFM